MEGSHGKPKIRIMVVDDFSGMRSILKQTLHLLGYDQVLEARSGQDALQKLKDIDCELIISDWTMPQMSGLEFLSALKGDERLSKVPFLMITAKTERVSVIEAAQAGVSHYMIKPFSADMLQKKIEAIFSRSAAN
jgi:two-component system chemotaxis response regulator CheY